MPAIVAAASGLHNCHKPSVLSFSPRSLPPSLPPITQIVRKSIARVLTVYNQTQKSKLREKFAGSKYVPLDLRRKKTRAIRRRLTKHEQGLKTVRAVKREQAVAKRRYALKA